MGQDRLPSLRYAFVATDAGARHAKELKHRSTAEAEVKEEGVTDNSVT